MTESPRIVTLPATRPGAPAPTTGGGVVAVVAVVAVVVVGAAVVAVVVDWEVEVEVVGVAEVDNPSRARPDPTEMCRRAPEALRAVGAGRREGSAAPSPLQAPSRTAAAKTPATRPRGRQLARPALSVRGNVCRCLMENSQFTTWRRLRAMSPMSPAGSRSARAA
ncbi:MAG: hypothetical protein M0Z69_05920, partial [Actinomycetota bacterium]|nr:hypothetical protein [Actinomycetota bacterium]